MEKYLTSVKDFVLETLSDFSLIRTSADRGDAEACFKMGMIHLLGINTKVDFKKASHYFSNQSLVNDKYANLLLGFIAECEGDFSPAFQNYAKTESSEKESYYDKVIKGRNRIQEYLKKLDLPVTMNDEISAILSDYSKKGKASKVGASIKMAAICNDEPSSLEAANALFDSNDYISAIQWLQKGKISPSNSLYAAINEIFAKSKDALLHSKDIQILDLDSNSLMSNEDPTPFLNNVKKTCDAASTKSLMEWKEKNKKRIDTIIKIQKEKEEKEWQAAQAENERKERRKKRIIKHSIICIVLFVWGVAANKEGGSGSEFISGVTMVLSCYFLFYLIRWIWRGIFGKKK